MLASKVGQIGRHGSESAAEKLRRFLLRGNTAYRYQASLGLTGLTVSSWPNQIAASQGGVAGPLLQGTGSAEPIYMSYNGRKYSIHPGVAGNYVSAPASADLTGDLDMDCEVDLNTAATGSETVISRWTTTGNQKSFLFTVSMVTKILNIYLSADGIANLGPYASTVAATITAGQDLYLRFKRMASTGIVTFYTSLTGLEGSWTQLGATVAGATGAIFAGTARLEIGSQAQGTVNPVDGEINSARIYNGDRYAGGTLVKEYVPNRDAVESGVNGYTFASSTTGEVYTVHNTGGNPCQIIGSRSILGDGAALFMQAAFALPTPYTIYLVFKANTWVSDKVIIDGVNADYEFSAQQFTATPQIRLKDAAAASATVSPVLQTWNILTAQQDAAGNWSLQLNNGTPVTGTGSATAMTGLTLFRKGLTAGGFAAAQIKEIIGNNTFDDATTKTNMFNWLRTLHGTT